MTSLEKKQTGSHYTPQNLANFVANSIFNISDFKTPKILDPACGDGSLLKAIREKFPYAQLYGFDLDENAVEETKKIENANVQKEDFLEYSSKYQLLTTLYMEYQSKY